MKTLIIAAALASTSALAHECNVNFEGELQLQNQELRIKTTDGQQVFINQQQQLFINDQLQTLDSQQQTLIDNYYEQVNQVAPITADIALDAVDVARKGVTMAFDELMGPGNELSQELDQSLSELQVQLNQNFYAQDGSIQFNSMQFEEDGGFSKTFSTELEQKIETVVQKSIGTLMIAIGKEMLFSGGDMQQFEQRMEDFGQNIEREIETSVGQIETRAEQLCYQLKQLDTIEGDIQYTIPQLAKLNILEVKHTSAKQM